MGCFIVQNGRDPQPGVISEVFLNGSIKPRVLINRQIMQRPQFTDSIRAFPCKELAVKDRSLCTQLFFAWIPPSCDLRYLLLKGHPGKQVRHPFLNR